MRIRTIAIVVIFVCNFSCAGLPNLSVVAQFLSEILSQAAIGATIKVKIEKSLL